MKSNVLARSVRGIAFGCLLVAVTGFRSPASAIPFTETLDFTAPGQSIWGTGGSIGFSYSASIGFTVPVLGNASVGYSVGANSGTVSAGFKGAVTADYAASLSSPGTTSISLSYQGQAQQTTLETVCFPIIGCFPVPVVTTPEGGQLTSALGAHAQLTSSLGNVGPDYMLNVDQSFTPKLGQPVSGSDSLDTVAQIAVIDAGVLGSAGVNMGVTQTDSFKASAIDGLLYYTLEGSGVNNSTPFILATDGGLSLPVDLTAPGTWDFWFVNQTLDNTFSTALALDLGLYYNTGAGCGPDLLDPCNGLANLASVNVYNGDPFALAFNSITNLNGFSIEVGATSAAQVPEPGTLPLFGVGIIGFAFLRRRRAV